MKCPVIVGTGELVATGETVTVLCDLEEGHEGNHLMNLIPGGQCTRGFNGYMMTQIPDGPLLEAKEDCVRETGHSGPCSSDPKDGPQFKDGRFYRPG